MDKPAETGNGSLYAVLRGVVERLRRAFGADIVSLYLFDAETEAFYAPVAVGLRDDDLRGSIVDLQDQLARYRADVAEGKAPAELRYQHYGPNVWLTVTRKPLVARDAPTEIDSSFIRRHHLQSVVGLPLLAGRALVGILYLNFAAKPGDARREIDADRLAAMEREAGQSALLIEQARAAEERRCFDAVGKLAVDSNHLSDGLARLLGATAFDALAVYQRGIESGRLDLAASAGPITPPASLSAPLAMAGASSSVPPEAAPLEIGGLRVVGSYPLRADPGPGGYLFVLSRDRLALARRAPLVRSALGTAASIVSGKLAEQRFAAALEDTNRVLGALSRMSGALLRPGATRQEVLEAIVRHLTDPDVPELDFQLAAAYLLDRAPESDEPETGAESPLTIQLVARAVAPASPAASPSGNGHAASPAHLAAAHLAGSAPRALPERDLLAYVATRWQVVVVGAAPDGVEDASLEIAYPADQVQRLEAPVARPDGSVVGLVPAALIGPAESGRRDGEAPFDIDAEQLDAAATRGFVRVFVPFGLDHQGPAIGVLEAGYHRAQKRRVERTPIESLRACAAQVAVAVETARMYEEVKRHAEQLELAAEVSKALASTIDLDQTLRIVARSLAQLVDASLCQIALYEEDGSAWFGAAASEDENAWRRMRGERPETSFLFDVLDRRAPLVVEDVVRSDLIKPYYARLFGVRSLLAVPLFADEQPIGAIVLAQRDRLRRFSPEEVQRTAGLAHQTAIAIKNARFHALAEEEHHIQKDVVLIGFGQWGQKAYEHLLTLKQFFNFKTHIVVPDPGEAGRDARAEQVQRVLANGDAFYWDSPTDPAHEQLRRQLESSCYVIAYVVTPAATHLSVVAQYYDLCNVTVIEKPLGATPEAYREFLDSVDGSVELVAADHYYFKLEVRLLQLLLTEERTLKAFLDSVEEIEVELLEARPLDGAAADIGVIADLIPHAFAIISLFTPIDRIRLAEDCEPLVIGRQEPLQGEKESYVRLTATFPHQGRTVRLIIIAGKGIEDSKWIKLSGERRSGGRRGFYKFDFIKGEAIDGTQTNLRAAVRRIREVGVPDTAHLSMLRHVIEKRHPAVGILQIREAIRSNQRILELVAMSSDRLARGDWLSYLQGQRPSFSPVRTLPLASPVPSDAPPTIAGARSAVGGE